MYFMTFYRVFVCFVLSSLHATIWTAKNDFPAYDDKYLHTYLKNVASLKINDDLPHSFEQKKKSQNDQNEKYENEKLAGDMTDLFGANVHFRQPGNYNNLGRRFVLQYPYGNGSESVQNQFKQNVNYLTPVKAPPELVLAVAKESAIQQALNPVVPVPALLEKSILRSGDFWNAVWKEDVDNPSNILRSGNDGDKSSYGIEVVQAKVMPGSKLFRLISVLKQISPRLLYVINKEKKK